MSNTSMTLTPPCPALVWPETSACNGGQCMNNTNDVTVTAACQCLQPDVYMGYGDFVFDGTTSCAINITAVRTLWAIVAASHCILFINCLVFLNAVRKQRRKLQLMLGFFSLLTAILFIALGTLRASFPKRTIGRDATVTVLFAFGALAFWSAAMVFLKLFVILVQTSAVSQVHATRSTFVSLTLRFLPVGQAMLLMLLGCANLSPILMLTCTTSQCMYGIALFHFFGLSFAMLISGSFATFTLLKPTATDIREHLSNMRTMTNTTPEGSSPRAFSSSSKISQLQSLLFKLDFAIREVRNQTVVNFLLAFSFGAIPYLQRLSSYELPIAWALSAFLLSIAQYTVSPVARPIESSSSSKEVARCAVEETGVISSTVGHG